jgi:hypothetical protein
MAGAAGTILNIAGLVLGQRQQRQRTAALVTEKKTSNVIARELGLAEADLRRAKTMTSDELTLSFLNKGLEREHNLENFLTERTTAYQPITLAQFKPGKAVISKGLDLLIGARTNFRNNAYGPTSRSVTVTNRNGEEREIQLINPGALTQYNKDRKQIINQIQGELVEKNLDASLFPSTDRGALTLRKGQEPAGPTEQEQIDLARRTRQAQKEGLEAGTAAKPIVTSKQALDGIANARNSIERLKRRNLSQEDINNEPNEVIRALLRSKSEGESDPEAVQAAIESEEARIRFLERFAPKKEKAEEETGASTELQSIFRQSPQRRSARQVSPQPQFEQETFRQSPQRRSARQVSPQPQFEQETFRGNAFR